MTHLPPTNPSNARLALFASGDFACNLYWQSLTFFLLFFYVEVARLEPAAAGLVLLIGSVWDGLADVAVGIWTQRRANYRQCIAWGAAPLGGAFALLYVVPPAHGIALVIAVTGIHLVFRSLYALVNVPFAAMTALITRDSGSRSRIAAFRMVYGTVAAIAVALVTRSASLTSHGTVTRAYGYALTAIAFAVVGTLILLLVASTAPRSEEPVVAVRPGLSRQAIKAVVGNSAFLTLNLAAAIAVVAAGVLNGSVLYYFTYVEHDPGAGPAAMAWMGIAGAIAIPFWMVLRDWLGTRGLWLADACFALVTLVVFASTGDHGVVATQIFLFAMQVALIGFAFAFWAMLPDTVEWGQFRRGVRVEGLTFGFAGFGQKLALGIANAVLGLLLSAAGYRGGHVIADPDQFAAAIRAIMLGVPATAIAGSAAVMFLNPLRRDTHGQIVAAIAARGAA